MLKLDAEMLNFSNEKSTITQRTSFASIVNKRCQILVTHSVSKLRHESSSRYSKGFIAIKKS